MAKATHKGHCQLCDRLQKLSNNLLSKHGYNVTWNMFVGVCPGSNNEPYEKSCDLLKETVLGLPGRILQMQEYITSIRTRTGNIGFFQHYKRGIGYYWEETEFSIENSYIGYFTKEGIFKSNFTPKLETPEKTARYYDGRYVQKVLIPNLNNLKNYLKWCENRIEIWELKDLEEI